MRQCWRHKGLENELVLEGVKKDVIAKSESSVDASFNCYNYGTKYLQSTNDSIVGFVCLIRCILYLA